MNGRVLLIDDDPDLCAVVVDGLSRRSFETRSVADAEAAMAQLDETDFDVVVTDVQLQGADGLDLCERIAARRPDVPVVVITAHGNLDVAIRAIRVGAYDFITKPFKMEALTLAVARAARHRALQEEVKRLRQEVRSARRIEDLVGDSPTMRRIYELVEQVSQTETTVLITGESGTGKELVARAVHDRSPRASGPFVAINCAAMPATLLESELFGHVRGAFTDAKRSRPGLFVQASHGTILLDEIGEMPLEMQAKLLRVLQEQRVRPVGGDVEAPFDARIVAATNRDLEEDVEEKRFREDLYYRINVVRIHMPPLRSRGHDILLLAQSFLERAAGRNEKPVVGISSGAAEKLLAYDWPGNVRELENCMERAVALTRYEQVTAEDLPDKIRDYQSTQLVISGDDPEEMPTLQEMERRYIVRVLRATAGNKTQAARVLGLDRRTLYRKLERLEIDPRAS